MDFEKIAIENADTVEEYRESLQAVCSDRGLSASRLKKMTQMLVGVDDLPKLDSAEQARRRNVSQRMQEKMTTWLVDNFEANNRRGRTDYEAIGDRRLTSDFLLQLPHPEQDEEFVRRAQILRSGTPQEKTDLFFQVLHQQMEGVTREKLMNLSDEEIVEDFDRLRLLQSVMANAKHYLDHPQLQMSQEQRQELAGPLTTIFTKAKLMATPAYAQVPLEQLPYRDSYYLSDREIEIWRSMDLSDQEEAVLKDMKACLNAFNTMGVRGAWVDDISRRELGGFHVSDVTWMDEKGESLGEQEQAEALIGAVKDIIVAEEVEDPQEIEAVINDTAKKMNIQLSEEDKAKIAGLMEKIGSLDLNVDALKEQAKDLYQKLEDMDIQISEEQVKGVLATIISWFEKIINVIKGWLGM